MTRPARLTPAQLATLERAAYAGGLRVSVADTATTVHSSSIRTLTRRGYLERRGPMVYVTAAGVAVLADAATQLELGADAGD